MQILRLDQLLNLHNNNPKDSFILFALSKEYEKAGQLQQARLKFEELLNTDPGYVGLYYHLGKLYEKLGDSKLAEKTYESGIKTAKEQGDEHSRSELASALELLG